MTRVVALARLGLDENRRRASFGLYRALGAMIVSVFPSRKPLGEGMKAPAMNDGEKKVVAWYTKMRI